MDVRALFLPEPRRRFPHGRAWNVAARTVHLALTGTLVGGHVFGAPAEALLPLLWGAIASGAVMFGLEMYSSLDWLTQIGGLVTVAKIGVLCAIPFAWSARVPLLFVVVGLAGVGSHMPGKYRHYSIVYRRSMKDSR